MLLEWDLQSQAGENEAKKLVINYFNYSFNGAIYDQTYFNH